MHIIYFIIILAATFVGAIAGLGGGLFIRPIFDTIAYHNALTISFFSSSAIATMAIANTIKKIKAGVKIEVKMALSIACGAIVGGFFGNILLEFTTVHLSDEEVRLLHAILTIIVVSIALFVTDRFKLKNPLKNPAAALPLGLIAGIIGTYLGLGGGIINVPFLMIFFGLGMKDATTNSIVIIFFAHTSRIITLGFTVGYAYFDLSFLFFIIPAAIFGGLLGASISKKFSDNKIKRFFQASLCFVIFINVFNAILILF
ncbi:MAG: sulfite exporter TauE/SafE family protein [Defluviitaleaceae bacterium]|nr:sulfite exporter TauE/SafE family protein [Defluviitaleaceae bacterium]